MPNKAFQGKCNISRNPFGLSSFLNSARKGNLETLIHEFLTTVGENPPLSNGLKKQKRYWIGPIEAPIERLVRCSGPEPSMPYRDDPDRYESIVEDNVIWAKHLERFVTAEPSSLIVDGTDHTPLEIAGKVLDWIFGETVFTVY